jgi:phosphoserine phosphatase
MVILSGKGPVRSGRLTGKLSTPAIKGDQKVKAIKRAFKLRDYHFRFFAAAGDSYGDRFLLEKCSLRYFPNNLMDSSFPDRIIIQKSQARNSIH